VIGSQRRAWSGSSTATASSSILIPATTQLPQASLRSLAASSTHLHEPHHTAAPACR
jgi:hypothetical protein